MEARQPSALDDFFFDLRGYLVLKQAAEPELIDDLNRVIDELPPLEYGQWHGNAQRRDYTNSTGLELRAIRAPDRSPGLDQLCPALLRRGAILCRGPIYR